MTPAALHAKRKWLGLSIRQAALFYGGKTHPRTIRRWECGTQDVPGPVMALMELLDRLPEDMQRAFVAWRLGQASDLPATGHENH